MHLSQSLRPAELAAVERYETEVADAGGHTLASYVRLLRAVAPRITQAELAQLTPGFHFYALLHALHIIEGMKTALDRTTTETIQENTTDD